MRFPDTIKDLPFLAPFTSGFTTRFTNRFANRFATRFTTQFFVPLPTVPPTATSQGQFLRRAKAAVAYSQWVSCRSWQLPPAAKLVGMASIGQLA